MLSWDGIGTGPGSESDRSLLITLYVVNGVMHFLWSPLFFTARRPDWALMQVPFLWASVLALTVFLREWSVLASWLIVPYLAWVSFATLLNRAIVQLNGPFGRDAV